MNKYDELGIDLPWIKRLLFAGIFIQENRLHTAYDHYGKITCKQWLLLVMLQAYNEAPDLSEIGKQMGCSRQNIKKLTISLQEKGFIDLKKNENDTRSICIYKTDKYYSFLKENEIVGEEAHNNLFKEFSDEEIKTYYELSKKILHGINNVDVYFRKLEKENKNENI